MEGKIALKRIVSGKIMPTPPPGEKLQRAGQKLGKLALVLGAVPALHKLRGGMGGYSSVTLIESVNAAVVAIVVAVFLHSSLSALEMQERWALEILEEEKRGIVDRMTLNMTQRYRFGGFLAQLHPRAATPPELVAHKRNSIRRLSLCSAASEGLTEDGLKQMVSTCVPPSLSSRVTGHILFVPPFLSIMLEGTPEDTKEAFKYCWHDQSHHTIAVIFDAQVKTRLFPEHGIKTTTIHPYQGFKGSIVVSIFQHLGQRFIARNLYSPKTRDVAEGHERCVSVVVCLFSQQPENFSLVSDILLEMVENAGGEFFFCGLDRLVFCLEDAEKDVVTLSCKMMLKAKQYLTDARFGAARGTVRRAPLSNRLYVGKCIERASSLAFEARNYKKDCYIDRSLHYLHPTVELVGNSFFFSETSVETCVSLPYITAPLDEIGHDELVRATFLSSPQSCDIAAHTHSVIRATVGKVVSDKMILVKSHTCRLVLLLLEGVHSDLLLLYDIFRKDKKHKYCFLAGAIVIQERIFSSEFEPLQVVSGDNWCAMLKQQIKLMTKGDDFEPEVIKRLASLNQFPAAIGMIPIPEQFFATLIPVSSCIATLAHCYKILADNSHYLWLDVVESTQRIVFSCKKIHAQKLVHLCVGFSKIVKSFKKTWLAVGIAAGSGLSGHIGKAHPIFFVSGQAFEKSWEMAISVTTKPNAYGSSMLICSKTALHVRQIWPNDPIVGLGSNGLHHLPIWGVYSVDHPDTDQPSRSLDATYYLCKRPLTKVLPSVMEEDYIEV